MTDERREAPKYSVHQAVNSAVGDYASVNNYFAATQAATDPAVAELRRLFEEVNQRLERMAPEDRALVVPAVEQSAQAAAEIQGGDESDEKQGFLEKRLKAIYSMAPDIGEVIITTLASPTAGIALTIQKIAKRALDDVKRNADNPPSAVTP